MGALISEAIKQGIAVGLPQSQRAASVQSEFHMYSGHHQVTQFSGEFLAPQGPHSPATSRRSHSSLSRGSKGPRTLKTRAYCQITQTLLASFAWHYSGLCFLKQRILHMWERHRRNPATESDDPTDLLFLEPGTEAEVIPSAVFRCGTEAMGLSRGGTQSQQSG